MSVKMHKTGMHQIQISKSMRRLVCLIWINWIYNPIQEIITSLPLQKKYIQKLFTLYQYLYQRLLKHPTSPQVQLENLVLILDWFRYRGRAKCVDCARILSLAPTQTTIFLMSSKVSHGLKPQIFSIGARVWNYVRNSHLSFKHAHNLRHSRSKRWGCICTQESYFNHNFCFFIVDLKP